MIRGLGWRLDGWLFTAVVALLALGVVASAIGAEESAAAARRQALFAGVGLLGLLGAARIDYRLLRSPALPATAYALALLALVAVLATGSSEFGSQRWLTVGGNTVQPSEFAKVALVLATARLAATRAPDTRALLASLALGAPVLGLVALEPDAGTALVLGAAWLALVVAWGVPWRPLAGIAVTAMAAAPLLFAVAVPDYQRERIATFVDPGRDPLGSGFTLQQVELALVSGGVTGRGLLSPADSALAFVPARASDFVFALVGEQLGLLGATTVLALLAVIGWRGLVAAAGAPDRLGRLLAAGLSTVIVAQAAVHVGVNLRLLPATGLPLPFVSQGGSALVAMALAAGVVASVAARRPPSSREQWTAQRWRA